MLENIDLSRCVAKDEYKKRKQELELKLAELQRKAKDLKIPIMIVFEGWDAAGKGTLINHLILPLDPRGFNVYSTLPPSEEEAHRPFLCRFWKRTPASGRIAIFDRSWYRRVLVDRVDEHIEKKELAQAFEDITSFERQLADDGNIIIKMFLHISKKEQKERFKKLRQNPATAWRVSEGDIKRHKQYKLYMRAIEDMLAETDSEYAPWTLIEAHDRRFADLKIFDTVITAIEDGIEKKEKRIDIKNAVAKLPKKEKSEKANTLSSTVLDRIDTSKTLDRDEYKKQLDDKQDELRELEHTIYQHRIPVLIAYEGWDAAGKGGNMRRLTQNLDPRGYEVVPIAAPNDIEKAHHYLWRFWNQMPKAGHITIFDRTWYGRVLVERVEGFCSEDEWRRAFREINEMEQHMTNFGAVIVKFWLHISKDEQLRRFKERQKTPHKQWKITDEDWRNREKWDKYKSAIEEMIFRTSTRNAPWTIVESNDKLYARVKCLDTVINAIKRKL